MCAVQFGAAASWSDRSHKWWLWSRLRHRWSQRHRRHYQNDHCRWSVSSGRCCFVILSTCMLCRHVHIHHFLGEAVLCLFHTADTDKTRLSFIVCVGGVNWIGDKSRQFSVVLNLFDTEQLQVGNWVETRWNSNWKLDRDKTKLSCLVTSSVHTADMDKTRQDSFVLSVSRVWNRH